MIALYYITAFFSAFLLFLIQPMFPKKLLPILGGTPALWNTCIFFYQSALLAGYAYTHFTTKLMTPRRHAVLHLALIASAAAFLPLTVNIQVQATPTEGPILWVLSTLAVTVGPLFFLLSTTAPLVQRWFAGTSGRGAGSPYHLYAISNAGSMAALLGYPFMIEPGLTYTLQLKWWSMGYWVFIILLATCAFYIALRGSQNALTDEADPVQSAPSSRDRLWWTALAFIPSSLLLGVTTHITTDIAAVPLLWVLPLAIYLLTFILTFGRRAFHAGRVMFWLQPILLMLVALNYLTNNGISHILTSKGVIGLQLSMFFVNAFICHSELSRRRPHEGHLTEFYLFISLGGALGGLFNALLAPELFSQVIEYPLVLLIAYFVMRYDNKRSRAGYAIDLLIAAVFGVLMFFADKYIFSGNSQAMFRVFLVCVVIFLFIIKNRYLAFALCIAFLFIGGDFSSSDYVSRSYFGTYKVVAYSDTDETQLINGRVMHGLQYHNPLLRSVPQSYYAPDEPFGVLYSAIKKRHPIRSVGVIGLGAGTMAAYSEPGQHWVFYEIDPIVVEIASDPVLFTYLSDSKGNVEIVTGDGRLSLAKAPDGYFDIIVIDAFSSDSIPVHLVSKEAFDMFSSKLSDNGVIIYHITNSYVSLSRPLRKLAEIEGKDSLYCKRGSASEWFAIAKGAEGFGPFGEIPACRPIQVRDGFRLWTDDYSSIIGALK